ncbi:hypothetical protein ABT246_34980 [Streptomyces sp. NPDC001553]|uniref:hypothetical protein n=1 Tax=Streptomyces sp. NPDC001553 TaxID=3154385 RepID=UPI00331D787C
MFKRHAFVLVGTTVCLVLAGCSIDPTVEHAPAVTQAPGPPSASQREESPPSSVPLPSPGTAGEIPNTVRLRELALQSGEAPGVPSSGVGIRDVHPGELKPLPETQPPAPCTLMWGLIGQRGAQAAITQTFDTTEPGNPTVTFLSSYSGTGATTTFARLRSAVAACPSDGSENRKATIRSQDLDKAGFPADTLRIQITVSTEGSDEPAEVMERIVARVGVCIVDMSGAGPEPYPGLSEEPVLRQIQRLQAAQDL